MDARSGKWGACAGIATGYSAWLAAATGLGKIAAASRRTVSIFVRKADLTMFSAKTRSFARYSRDRHALAVDIRALRSTGFRRASPAGWPPRSGFKAARTSTASTQSSDAYIRPKSTRVLSVRPAASRNFVPGPLPVLCLGRSAGGGDGDGRRRLNSKQTPPPCLVRRNPTRPASIAYIVL